MNRVVLITSNHRRHYWFAAKLARAGLLCGVVCEAKPTNGVALGESENLEVSTHFGGREVREAHWFADAPECLEALHVPVMNVPWGQSNGPEVFNFVEGLAPDYIQLFGSSIIRDPLLKAFERRVVNMHLGLSPYYRGSGTNFWPLVDGVPECVGVTVHHATLRVDGGNILAQARPPIDESDESHDLGCKTIMAGADLILEVLSGSSRLPPGFPQSGEGKLCRRADFNSAALAQMRDNFKAGMVLNYLMNKDSRDARYPIVVPSA